MVQSPLNKFAYLLGSLRSGGSIAKRRRLGPSRAWAEPCRSDIGQTLHREMSARETNLRLFGALSIRRDSWLSPVRMPSPSFQRSLRSVTLLHYYGNPDRSRGPGLFLSAGRSHSDSVTWLIVDLNHLLLERGGNLTLLQMTALDDFNKRFLTRPSSAITAQTVSGDEEPHATCDVWWSNK